MIIGIVCADRNWGIGKDNGLLFKLPGDMKFFKNQTTGEIVVCGLNTLKSFPGSKPLPGRSTFVLAPEGYERDDCAVFSSFETLLTVIKELSKTKNVYIIGGAMFYKSMVPYYDKVYVTKVDAEDPEATAFFPNLDENSDFTCTYLDTIPVEDNGYRTELAVYKRISKHIV